MNVSISFYPINHLREYRYSVLLARFEGQWLFSRKKGFATWETPGGHIEPGESPLAAAKRELFEETGALKFSVRPIFDYCVGSGEDFSNGVVFLAEVSTLGALPESEMEECRTFAMPPANLTYPGMQDRMFQHYQDEIQWLSQPTVTPVAATRFRSGSYRCLVREDVPSGSGEPINQHIFQCSPPIAMDSQPSFPRNSIPPPAI